MSSLIDDLYDGADDTEKSRSKSESVECVGDADKLKLFTLVNSQPPRTFRSS